MFPLYQILQGPCDAMAQVPVSQLRRDPSPFSGGPQQKDLSQESQVLFGEQLRIIKEDGDWVQVEAIEQPYFSKEGDWQGYPGWVPKRDLAEPWVSGTAHLLTAKWTPLLDEQGGLIFELPLGATIWLDDSGRVQLPGGGKGVVESDKHTPLLDKPLLRKELLTAPTQMLLGDPYFWGGRSPYHPKLAASSYDCSGLVQILHRLQGWVLPRDAKHQALACEILATGSANAGDLFFLRPSEDSPIEHVGIFSGNGQLIEATEISQSLRETPVADRFAKLESKPLPACVCSKAL